MSSNLRCTRPKTTESCLTCPYPMCKYDTKLIMDNNKGIVVGVDVDEFKATTFKDSVEAAHWLYSHEKIDSKSKTLDKVSANIRGGINSSRERYGLMWYRLNKSLDTFFSYTQFKSELFVSKSGNGWSIVKRKLGGGKLHRALKGVYQTKDIAQLVLDFYADSNGLRVFQKIAI